MLLQRLKVLPVSYQFDTLAKVEGSLTVSYPLNALAKGWRFCQCHTSLTLFAKAKGSPTVSYPLDALAKAEGSLAVSSPLDSLA
jgi:hypothetical protein